MNAGLYTAYGRHLSSQGFLWSFSINQSMILSRKENVQLIFNTIVNANFSNRKKILYFWSILTRLIVLLRSFQTYLQLIFISVRMISMLMSEKEFSMINDPFHQQYFDKSSTMVYLFSISFSREVPSAFDCSYLNRIIQMNMNRKIANAKKQTKGNRRKEKELLNYLR